MEAPSIRPRLTADPIDLAVDNWRRSGWTDAADGMAAVTSVMRVQQLFLAAVEDALAPFGLSFARYEVLMLLSFSRQGSLPAGKIGERLQVHAASVTNALNRLQRSGYVDRTRDADDGRILLASITDAGRSVAQRSTETLNRDVFESLPMSTADVRRLRSVTTRVRQVLGDFP